MNHAVQSPHTPLLDQIHSPEDLKKLPEDKIDALCEEIRADLIKTVCQTGGHLASNLGVVELTVAIHRVFSAPTDSIIWDVGHQSYVHKLLTGRAGQFSTLRSPGGLSGFTKRSESPYDPFGAGHSSTSLSAAIGIAQAKKCKGDPSFTVAVLGDGAFTGGLIHEALNNLDSSLRLILILNENEMSISRNIGGFAHHLKNIRTTKGYYRTKRVTRNILYHIPLIGKPIFLAVRRLKKMLKNAVYHSNYFEDLGIYYMGPADGHDVPTLCRMLREAMQEKQPVVLHVKTSKGKGYPPAEAEPNRYHGIPPKSLSSQTDCQPIHYSTRMGQILCQEAEKDNRIVAITAAMADGCGLVEFSKKFPKRFFDVGIAEEHALVFAAGLACQGMIPVFAVYSTFLQRGYDNILHDIALQGLPVIICIDRASLSSGDGPTHHGIYDVAFLSHIPGITLLAPFDFASLSDCMTYALQAGSPVCLRYPNAAEDLRLRSFCSKGDFGIRFSFDSEESVDVILISYGKIASEALKAVDNLQEEGIKGGLVLLEQLKPLQAPAKALLHRLSSKKVPILFLEEGIKNGSAAMLLYEEIRSNPLLDQRIYQILAIDDQFGFSKAGETIYESCHISALDLCRAVKECLSKDKKETNPGDRI